MQYANGYLGLRGIAIIHQYVTHEPSISNLPAYDSV